MKAEIEVISPAQAKELLERNITNRPINKRQVARYASDMRSERWVNNGQTVVITAKGDLLDGQHRMAAIIAAQKNVAMLVVRGADPQSFVTMDTGRSRNLSDVLHIQGFRHTIATAAGARLAWNYVAGVNLTYSPTVPVLNEFIARHPYMAEVSTVLGAHVRNIPKGPLAAVLFLANEKRELDEEVANFLEGVVYGTGLWKGDARLTLRNWLTTSRERNNGVSSKAYLTSDHVFAAITRAWNAFGAGNNLEKIMKVDAPTRDTLPIFGFEPRSFGDVPDISRQLIETRLSALDRARIPRTVDTKTPEAAAG
jgi:hypothetical protein